ncbi:MAG: hypothetical protein LH628_15040 [Microcoleus sp. CAN_BIN18]|nr:hypothetical protein [Microcoleus sp. CAN_BIN18]
MTFVILFLDAVAIEKKASRSVLIKVNLTADRPWRHIYPSQNHLDCRAIALTFSLPTPCTRSPSFQTMF